MSSLKKIILGVLLASSVSLSSVSAYDNLGMTDIESSTNVDINLGNILSEYILSYPQYEFQINDTFGIIVQSDNFQFALEHNPDSAYKILNDNMDFLVESLDIDNSITLPQYVSNGIYAADYTVPVVKQQKTYNCGIAAALQALIGDGILENTSSNKSLSKQNQLENQINSSCSETYSQYQRPTMIEYILNEYSSGSYTNLIVTRYTVGNILTKMKTSLKEGYCPVVLVDDTSYLDYYNNCEYSHYVTVSRINAISGTVTVVDPFNSSLVSGSSSSFGGTHTVDDDDLIDGIGTTNGWVICHES